MITWNIMDFGCVLLSKLIVNFLSRVWAVNKNIQKGKQRLFNHNHLYAVTLFPIFV